jgi:hypothetical protein
VQSLAHKKDIALLSEKMIREWSSHVRVLIFREVEISGCKTHLLAF